MSVGIRPYSIKLNPMVCHIFWQQQPWKKNTISQTTKFYSLIYFFFYSISFRLYGLFGRSSSFEKRVLQLKHGWHSFKPHNSAISLLFYSLFKLIQKVISCQMKTFWSLRNPSKWYPHTWIYTCMVNDISRHRENTLNCKKFQCVNHESMHAVIHRHVWSLLLFPQDYTL